MLSTFLRPLGPVFFSHFCLFLKFTAKHEVLEVPIAKMRFWVSALKFDVCFDQADDLRTKGHEYLQPRVDQMKQRFEPLKFWVYYIFLSLCWLSVAFLLHWKTHKWFFSAVAIANPQNALGGSGLGGHSLCFWPNSNIGCQFMYWKVFNLCKEHNSAAFLSMQATFIRVHNFLVGREFCTHR